MSKMDLFFNLSPLNTTVSRKVISFSDISAREFDGRVEFVSLFNKLIHTFFITVPEGEDIVSISSPFFWLGFALLYQRCLNFSHENIGKRYCRFSSHGGSMWLEIVLSIELERIFV